MANDSLGKAICAALRAKKTGCLAVRAEWGDPTVRALQDVATAAKRGRIGSVILLQDFTAGGARYKEATEHLKALNVPVFKAIRLIDISAEAWKSGKEGLPSESVYYRVAMPEMIGASQPAVLAAASPPRIDPLTGIEVRVTVPITEEVTSLAERVSRWHDLQIKANRDKKVGIIFYNHPPGRHNIGADNLDVSASLWEILRRLKREGYHVENIPETPDALLKILQKKAVNLPENHKALKKLAENGGAVSAEAYKSYFKQLPATVRAEMTGGPLDALYESVETALKRQDTETARHMIESAAKDVAFVIEGADASLHARAEDLLDQLKTAYLEYIKGEGDQKHIKALTEGLKQSGVAALDGWGAAPGAVMTVADDFVFPGVRFGNIFIGPQPPRGVGLNEEALHANMSVPPPHHYLAFYHWLDTEFKADALIHLGRHSTYEFLPGKRVGLTASDYPRLIARNIPGLYPYIVDGVGEGLQAKRRGLAVVIDHLTPPLKTTPMYDSLLELRHMVETYEAADPSQSGDAVRDRALREIRKKVVELGIKDALIAELEAEHGGGETFEFETLEPDLLVHEAGHFLTEMQEDYMPLGLHIFGRPWQQDAVETMLTSMRQGGALPDDARAKLEASPEAEMTALIGGLAGGYTAPGKGNDPLRAPEALPTGRNFHGLDASMIPTRVAWHIGRELAEKARAQGEADTGRATVLWASDTVRDGGAMIAFGMDMLGVKPVWNSRGILSGLERPPLEKGRKRYDMSFVSSGLFRDLYGAQIIWLDKAALLALDASFETIIARHPKLKPALLEALRPLGALRNPGAEPLDVNLIAAQWVRESLEKIEAGQSPREAGLAASARIFAPAPGSYGAGINTLAERSGAWEKREELAKAYIGRLGHAYGARAAGEPVRETFKNRISRVRHTHLGRASNLYGLVDNNDVFDYLGGLNLAVELAGGQAPQAQVADLTDPQNPDVSPLASAIMREIRGKQLNPAWIKALLPHGYAGARTMNMAFFENLWGWEATDPDLFPDRVWEEAEAVYMQDKYALGLDKFLEKPENKPVKANMAAIMLTAAHKGYWQADEATIRSLAETFARLVREAGLPGSGHTQPDHPALDWAASFLSPEQQKALNDIREAARGPQSPSPEPVHTSIKEITPVQEAETPTRLLLGAGLVMLLILLAGMYTGFRRSKSDE